MNFPHNVCATSQFISADFSFEDGVMAQDELAVGDGVCGTALVGFFRAFRGWQRAFPQAAFQVSEGLSDGLSAILCSMLFTSYNIVTVIGRTASRAYVSWG